MKLNNNCNSNKFTHKRLYAIKHIDNYLDSYWKDLESVERSIL